MRFQKYRDQCGLRPKAWFRRRTFLAPNLIEPNFVFGANLIQTAHRVSTLPNLTLLPHQTKTAFSAFTSYSLRQKYFKDFSPIFKDKLQFFKDKDLFNKLAFFNEGLDGGGGYKCHLSVKILAIRQLSLKF